jgi:alkylation response protein AidB-like acyl-CoA dehydrogenase
MAFRGVDYFCVDSLFSEEELMVRQTARRFAEERIAPLIRDCLSGRALSRRIDSRRWRSWAFFGRQSRRLWLRWQ